MRDQANLPQIRPSFGLTSTATDPLASVAIPHWWYDGVTLWLVSASGVAVPVSGGGGAPVFSARAKTAAAPPAATYANGTLGGGATLTADGNGALGAVGGVNPLVIGNTVLVDQQVAPAQNGLYTVVRAGSATTTWQFVRLIGFDTAARIVDGALVTVKEGTFANELWEQTATVTTVGTSAITFDQPTDLALLGEAQTFTAIKTFAGGSNPTWDREVNHVLRPLPSTTLGAVGAQLTTQGAAGTAASAAVAGGVGGGGGEGGWGGGAAGANGGAGGNGGGRALVRGGAATGAGTNGTVEIGDATTSQVNFPAAPVQIAAVHGFGAAQTLVGAGAVDVVHRTTRLTTDGVGNALTLADGTQLGQRKSVVLGVLGAGGQTGVLTPASFADGATITFANVFDGVELEWNGAA